MIENGECNFEPLNMFSGLFNSTFSIFNFIPIAIGTAFLIRNSAFVISNYSSIFVKINRQTS